MNEHTERGRGQVSGIFFLSPGDPGQNLRTPCRWLESHRYTPTPLWIDGELGAQRGRETGPRSHSKLAAETGLTPGTPASQSPSSPGCTGPSPMESQEPAPQTLHNPIGHHQKMRGTLSHWSREEEVCPRRPACPRPQICSSSPHSSEARTSCHGPIPRCSPTPVVG